MTYNCDCSAGLSGNSGEHSKVCSSRVVTNNNEWRDAKVLEYSEIAGQDYSVRKAFVKQLIKECQEEWYEIGYKEGQSSSMDDLIASMDEDEAKALKDCQRKTLELVLPEDRGNFDLGEKDPYLSGFTDCRSEMLRRASEAGINIEGL